MTSRGAADFFHSYAHDFDAIYGGHGSVVRRIANRYLRASMRLRYEKCLQGCQPVPGKRIIDVGCGPGHYAIALARMGAQHALGLDFAPAMIELARQKAADAGVAECCTFEVQDLLLFEATERFDHAIVMGFMDYASEPGRVIDKVLGLTGRTAFFSFPDRRGVLAWQRRLRYRRKTPLNMYSPADVDRLFRGRGLRRITVKKLARDLFVTAEP
jgi:SAM-dependent methyltransferase